MASALAPSSIPSMVGSYPVACECARRGCPLESSVSTFLTAIWLVVRVPVLSEQMTAVVPSVSTEGRYRTCT
eukprot:scaffold16864_cov27-Tisochrysis_lutea.AAC.4